MAARLRRAWPAELAALLLAAGCASAPQPVPTPTPPPAATPAPPVPETGLDLVANGEEPEGAEPPFLYRFRQVEPGSDRFTFQDRDLSFYFRPTPEAVHFQVENRQDQPVWIEWDKSVFVDGQGRASQVAHRGTRWQTRFSPPPPTRIGGLERYSDYVLPLEVLVDPAGSEDQIHKRVFPMTSSALQYVDQVFGVDLVFRVEEKPRTYSFRFKVASIVPR